MMIKRFALIFALIVAGVGAQGMGTRPPQGMGTRPPQDQGTRPPRDQGTRPPQDQGTRPPRDQGTRPPQDERTPACPATPDVVEWTDPIDYQSVAADIAALISENTRLGPTIVRLAWHASGTYDKETDTGGSGGGTIRFAEELQHTANAGLTRIICVLEPVHQKYAAAGLSYGDLYTLAGVTAIRTLGGPTIPWGFGRSDALDASAVPAEGRLPSPESGSDGSDQADLDHLRSIFYRMGFDDREIVCLSGAHALGRCHPNVSGYDGPWTSTPLEFSNHYFSVMLNLEWVPKEWDGPFQYVNAINGQLMMLPTDLVLLEDPDFLQWVEHYASNESQFFLEFSEAFQKLTELGTTGLTPIVWA
jgi:cytochrome c peroxidase